MALLRLRSKIKSQIPNAKSQPSYCYTALPVPSKLSVRRRNPGKRET